MPRLVKWASWLAFGLHGILILTARYRLSYDAYNHMFFADHYRLDWWSLWEPRWYTGFEIVSYPPLVHQLIALLGRLIGVDWAFAFILWTTLVAYPLAVYLFARIFVGRVAAGYAAIGAALLPSLYLTAHAFGQLPTLFATLMALFGAAVLADFLRHGSLLAGSVAVGLFTTVMAAHHATLLFLPWLVGAVVVKIATDVRRTVFNGRGSIDIKSTLTGSKPTVRCDALARRRQTQILVRLGIFALLATLAGFLVIFPFWGWGAQQTLQATIDHASRHNYFRDPLAALIFFLPAYGLFIPLIPFALWIARLKRFWGPGLAFFFLFLLGLGGTTPLPRLFFGPGWAWLTYDRFAFWASLMLLVFFGAAVVMLRDNKWFHHRAHREHGDFYLFSVRSVFSVVNLLFIAMIFTALLVGLIPTWLPTQPRQLDMQPVVDFLAENDRWHFRYLTFGFGDQLAYLSRLTEATTIDGSYHTARGLPELRASGLGQVDTAYWIPDGLNALDPILQKSGERGVRWGFVNSKFFVPVLWRNGWRLIGTLSNKVMVWENPNASFPPPVRPPVETPFTAFAWGTFPLFALMTTSALALRRYRPALSASLMPAIQSFALGLLPLALSFWAYRRLFAISHERIYFTYSDALFYLSDGIALVIVLAGLVNNIPIGPRPHPSGVYPVVSQRRAAGSRGTTPQACGANGEPAEGAPSPKFPRTSAGIWGRAGVGAGAWLFALCALASLSARWSLDWRTSLYVSLHGWLVFGLYLSLRERPQFWRPFALGSAAALLLQIFIGLWQVFAQSTEFSLALGLDWPGDLLPAMSGTSVVQLPDGTRWLRAYGTFPHPNLLGGWTLVLLASLLTLILLPSKGRNLALVLFSVGLILLGLTFSRSAWLGLLALGAVLLAKWKRLDRKSLRILAVAGLFCIVVLTVPLQQVFSTRLKDSQVQTEQVSSFTRSWLVQRTWEIIRQEPVTGVGVGSYTLALSRHVPAFYDIEPVHNLSLLAWSELGPGAVIVLAGLVFTIAVRSFQARRPLTIIFSAVLAGLIVLSFFDHYLWTLAPGRLLAGTVLGLWAGQVNYERGC